MKQIFKPISILLVLTSALITWVCASLIDHSPGGDWVVRSYSIWGDWSAHLTFINAFRERALIWVTGPNPLMNSVPFQYPFLSHAFTAGFASLFRIPSIEAMRITSLLLLFGLPFLIFRFFRAFGFSSIASIYGTLCFVLIGGLQFIDSSLDPLKPLTNQFERGSVFTQFVLFEFYPQRAFLFGLSLFLFAAPIVLHSPSRPKRIVAGVCLSLLPLVHLHTYLAVGVLLLIMACIRGKKSDFMFGLGVAAFSFLGVLFLFYGKSNHIHWDSWAPFWAQSREANLPFAAKMNPLWFWIYNTGFFIPLAALGFFTIKRTPNALILGLSGSSLFGFALFFKIQPYFYDNLKLFTYSFLFFAPLVGEALARVHARIPILALVILGIQISSASHDLYFFAKGSEYAVWFKESEIEVASQFKAIRKSTDDLVLIVPRHNHWVPALSGNPVVMGYAGWLWSWGIPYVQLEDSIYSILTGQPDALPRLNTLHPLFIVVERGETLRNTPLNETFLTNHFKKVLDDHGWIIYQTEFETKSPK